MKKRVFNKWFFLAVLLMASLSAFSFLAYKEARRVCIKTKNCGHAKQNGAMVIEAVSRQFASFISFQ